MREVRPLIFIAGLTALLCGSGCIIPMSGPPKVQLSDKSEPVSVAVIAGNGPSEGVIYPGLTRAEVHQRLAGLPVQGFAPGESGPRERDVFGPFEKEITYLYVAAWHGPHSWGFHPRT